MSLYLERHAVVDWLQIPLPSFIHSETIGVMRPVRAERGSQFRRHLHPLRFQFLERLRHRIAVVANHQVGNQMVVLDDLQLILGHVFLNGVRSEIDPLRKVIETFALVLRRLDDLA